MDDGAPEAPPECCVCFEAYDHATPPCRFCGSRLPVCEGCLQSWSSATQQVRSCAVCRTVEGRLQRRSPRIDLDFDQERPLLTASLIFASILVYYWWVFVVFSLQYAPP